MRVRGIKPLSPPLFQGVTGANPSYLSGRWQGPPWWQRQPRKLPTAHREQFRGSESCSRILQQAQFRPRGEGMRTSNLPITSRAALPAELQLSLSPLLRYVVDSCCQKTVDPPQLSSRLRRIRRLILLVCHDGSERNKLLLMWVSWGSSLNIVSLLFYMHYKTIPAFCFSGFFVIVQVRHWADTQGQNNHPRAHSHSHQWTIKSRFKVLYMLYIQILVRHKLMWTVFVTRNPLKSERYLKTE